VKRRALERAFDQAEILRVLDVRAVLEQLDRCPRRRGTRTIRAILEEHYIGSTPTWNEFEEAFLALVRRVGLPDPEVNGFVDPGDWEPAIRVDFVWRRERVAVETDGRRTHLTRQGFENDRRRDQRLTVAGWRALRTTWRQVHYESATLERTLTALVLSPR
jgi:hypothetical protein